MSNLILTLIHGFLVGILISAPMGPVGVLCIRRTLHRGRRAGLVTGAGAALSDLLYASLTYMGVGLVADFLWTHQTLLEFIGSICLLAFGIYLYRSAPSYDTNESERSSGLAGWRLFGSSFIITFSNPLIILIYIALFSRFSLIPDLIRPGAHFFVTMGGIVLGALSWWWVITYTVDKVRKRASLQGIRNFNRIVAIIFAIVSFLGMLSCLYQLLFSR